MTVDELAARCGGGDQGARDYAGVHFLDIITRIEESEHERWLEELHEHPTHHAAFTFLAAYGEWQTLFALHRMSGWSGSQYSAPPEIAKAYAAFLEAIDSLHMQVHGKPRPDYGELAKKRMPPDPPAPNLVKPEGSN